MIFKKGGKQMVEIYHSGPAAFIAALYDELGIGRTIDEMVSWDQRQCRLSPGTRIKALVINIFGRRRPLYRVDEFDLPPVKWTLN